jgi:hypothetical protein
MVIEINFGCHQMIRMSLGHFDCLMTPKINFGHLEAGIGFKMVIEIGSVTLRFNLAMEGNQIYFECHLMTYYPFKVMVIGWQPNRFNHYPFAMTNHLRQMPKSTPFG